MHGHHGRHKHKGRGKHKFSKHWHLFKWSHKKHKHHGHLHKDCLKEKSEGLTGRLTTLFQRKPEDMSPSVKNHTYGRVLNVDTQRCKACGKCMQACSEGAIEVSHTTAVINHRLCVGCGACVEACPTGAITP